ncbi:disulfide isomerase [Helicobacter anseris]|uniref:Disulfide isomerase n=1 Tax=Helicobacter anseris TaxID=375926 RepID=A0A3D8JAP5_9HELI|nr:disulfide isomerase [Helicobacter anseris]RDU74559.1 disulfide isomerase [Helicobacter anseris]
MKKFFFIFLFSFVFMQANMQENLTKLIKEKTKQDIKVMQTYDLKANTNFKVVILEDTLSKTQIPIITDKDGSMLFALTNIFFSVNEADTKLIGEIIQKIQSQNDKQVNSAAINKLLESIPDDYVIKLNSTTKNNQKITYIISDPMCPHCQDELRHIDEKLKESNVYMVLVAYMGQDSINKAANILEKIKSLKETKEKVNLLQQVYATTFKAQESNAKEIKKVENITKKIADSGLIKGVPFIYEYK